MMQSTFSVPQTQHRESFGQSPSMKQNQQFESAPNDDINQMKLSMNLSVFEEASKEKKAAQLQEKIKEVENEKKNIIKQIEQGKKDIQKI